MYDMLFRYFLFVLLSACCCLLCSLPRRDPTPPCISRRLALLQLSWLLLGLGCRLLTTSTFSFSFSFFVHIYIILLHVRSIHIYRVGLVCASVFYSPRARIYWRIIYSYLGCLHTTPTHDHLLLYCCNACNRGIGIYRGGTVRPPLAVTRYIVPGTSTRRPYAYFHCLFFYEMCLKKLEKLHF